MNIDALVKFLSNSSAAMIALGSLTIVLGLTGGDTHYGVTVGPKFQWLALIIGVLLVFFGYISGRSGSPETSPRMLKRDYGASVSVPPNGSVGKLPFIIRGTFKKVPPDPIKVWLFTESERKGDQYWPQGEVDISGNSWSYTIRDKKVVNGVTLRCRLYLLSPDGEAFVRLYFLLNERRSTGEWRSIKTLPPNCIVPSKELMTFDFSSDPALS